MRARMSVTLPAVNGTTIVTRWLGKFCAAPGATIAMLAATAASPIPKFRRSLMAVPLLMSLERRRFGFLPRSVPSR